MKFASKPFRLAGVTPASHSLASHSFAKNSKWVRHELHKLTRIQPELPNQFTEGHKEHGGSAVGSRPAREQNNSGSGFPMISHKRSQRTQRQKEWPAVALDQVSLCSLRSFVANQNCQINSQKVTKNTKDRQLVGPRTMSKS